MLTRSLTIIYAWLTVETEVIKNDYYEEEYLEREGLYHGAWDAVGQKRCMNPKCVELWNKMMDYRRALATVEEWADKHTIDLLGGVWRLPNPTRLYRSSLIDVINNAKGEAQALDIRLTYASAVHDKVLDGEVVNRGAALDMARSTVARLNEKRGRMYDLISVLEDALRSERWCRRCGAWTAIIGEEC